MAPVFLLLLFAILGAGLDGYYQLLLDDATRLAARQIQIAGGSGFTGQGFVAAVCGEFGRLATDCTTNLSYDVQSNSPPASFASLSPAQLGSGGQLPDTFQPAVSGSNVLVQAAYPLPVSLPFIGAAITLTGTNAILAVTTVRVE